MDIIEKYNQGKESTIQYDISELLHIQLSDHVMMQLEKINNNDVNKFLSFFPIKSKSKLPEIKKTLTSLKKIIPEDLYEDTKEEVKEIISDYRWAISGNGRKVLQIEEWIKRARLSLSNSFSSEFIYIGRSFINPISLIIGGYVKDMATKETIEIFFNKMLPPIAIEYKINIYE